MPTPKCSRLNALLRHDLALLSRREAGCLVIGLDEVGRGSLIGPVVGGAVCIPRNLTTNQKKLLKWLDDSKRLTPEIRAELSETIHAFCRVGIGQADKEEVDRLNVHYASLLALHRALNQLCGNNGICLDTDDVLMLLDGRPVIPDLPRERQQAIVKGDALSASIAAASIVAKHARDTMIKALAREYPGYGWEDNMGYGTPAHQRGIEQLGLTPHHRINFKRVQQQILLPFGS